MVYQGMSFLLSSYTESNNDEIQQARDNGNSDAAERLSALSQTSPQGLSRQEHDAITENKLVRKRTQAKQRSDAQGQPPMPYPPGSSHILFI